MHRLMFITCLLLSFTIVGCVQLRFPQIQSSQAFWSGYQEQSAISEYIWTVQVGGFERQFIQIDLNQSVGFTNAENEAIIFKNNKIQAIGPLGQSPQLLRIVDTNRPDMPFSIKRQTYVQGQLFATEYCSPWEQVSTTNLVQFCQSATLLNNEMELDDNGDLIKLSQYNPYYQAFIQLQKK